MSNKSWSKTVLKVAKKLERRKQRREYRNACAEAYMDAIRAFQTITGKSLKTGKKPKKK